MAVTELRQALAWVWRIAGVVVLCVLLTPFVLGEDPIARWTPVCQAKAQGRTCSLCGMTTAFLAVSRGGFRQAEAANAGAIPLYCAFLFNELWLAASVGRRFRQGGRPCPR